MTAHLGRAARAVEIAGSGDGVGAATLGQQLAELHDPVVDIIPPPPLHLVVRGSPRAELVLFIMQEAGVQGVGAGPGRDGPLSRSPEDVPRVTDHVKLSIDRAGQHRLQQ